MSERDDRPRTVRLLTDYADTLEDIDGDTAVVRMLRAAIRLLREPAPAEETAQEGRGEAQAAHVRFQAARGLQPPVLPPAAEGERGDIAQQLRDQVFIIASAGGVEHTPGHQEAERLIDALVAAPAEETAQEGRGNGRCVCGHLSSEHACDREAGDDSCGVCSCEAFAIPRVGPPAAEGETLTCAHGRPILCFDCRDERRRAAAEGENFHACDYKPKDLFAAPAAEGERPDALGLSIDMLMADRLRLWADRFETYGDRVSEWGSREHVIARLRETADALAQAVGDIGILRARRASVAPGLEARLDEIARDPHELSVHVIEDMPRCFVKERLLLAAGSGLRGENVVLLPRSAFEAIIRRALDALARRDR